MARLNQRLGLTRYEADEYYKKALAAYEKRNLDEALINMNDAIQALPTNPEYYATRGFFFVEDDVPDKAEADFEKALKIHPYEMLAHYGRGIIAFRNKKWDEALQHFLNAYYADPKRAETLYYLAIVYHRRGENANAVHVMRQAHELLEAAGDKRRSDALKWIRTLEKIPDAPRLQSGTG
jgi:tetratricopeptide (TPR) repeat protein